MKRLRNEAYTALADALSKMMWNKTPFENFIRMALRDHPDLVAGLPFSDTKRTVADELVVRLAAKDLKYQDFTLGLILEISSMKHFPNLEQIKDPEDRALRIQQATKAVEYLRELTAEYADQLSAQEQAEVEREARRAQEDALRTFSATLGALKSRFLELHGRDEDPHCRGKEFESLLTDLFILFDMEPRLAYSLANEQIDGSLSFDTDDYIVEARWRKGPVNRRDGDVFDSQVRRKGKNALGLFVSVNGFTQPLLDTYKEATPSWR